MAAVTAVPASSSRMPAAISAPKTASSRISVTGTEVTSALRKSWPSCAFAARSALAAPASAMCSRGFPAAAAATARCAGSAAWSTFAELPGTVKVTSALRPSADTRPRGAAPGRPAPGWPAPSGDRMSPAECGSAASTAVTCRTARRIAGSVRSVPAWPGRSAISTLSTGGALTPSRCRVRSAWPDEPGSYCGRFFIPSSWPPTKAVTTRASQPRTAVLRYRALHPAIRSTTGARPRLGGPAPGPDRGW